jgi:hypothetical protein
MIQALLAALLIGAALLWLPLGGWQNDMPGMRT